MSGPRALGRDIMLLTVKGCTWPSHFIWPIAIDLADHGSTVQVMVSTIPRVVNDDYPESGQSTVEVWTMVSNGRFSILGHHLDLKLVCIN